MVGGVEAGIKLGIHAMSLLWVQHSQEEYWWFILIDAQNAFNEDNRNAMIWSVWHEWPCCKQFTFNYYRHWATLVVRDSEDGSGKFLHSKERVTQGDPLSMITYGIGVSLLSKSSKTHALSSPLHVMLMTQGQQGTSSESLQTSKTCRRGGHFGANSRY